MERYPGKLAADVHHVQGITLGQCLAYCGSRMYSLYVCSLGSRHAGELVMFLGHSVYFPARNVDCLYDQLAFGQLAGRYLLFAHDIRAFLADASAWSLCRMNQWLH